MKLSSDVQSQIQKLLALSESTNEHEAVLALRKARELLTRHGLTMSDIRSNTEESKGATSRVDFGKKVCPSWMVSLGTIVGEFFDCKTLYTPSQVVFIGVKQDVEIAAYSFTTARDRIEWLAYVRTGENTERFKAQKGFSPRQLTGANHPKTWRNSWMSGFLSGLSSKLESVKQEQDEQIETGTAIVLAKNQIIQSVLDSQFSNRGSFQTSMTRSNSSALRQGEADGREFSLSLGIETSSSNRRLLEGA